MHVVDGEQASGCHEGNPRLGVDSRLLVTVTAVDEHHRRPTAEQPSNHARPTDHDGDDVLHARGLEGPAQVREGVHAAGAGVDHRGVMVLPPGLDLLGAAVMVNGHDVATGDARRVRKPEGRPTAIGADLDDRARVDPSERLDAPATERGALVVGHESSGDGDDIGEFGVDRWRLAGHPGSIRRCPESGPRCQHGEVQDDVDALVRLLDLEPIEVNLFRGVSPDEDRQRVFGGQVAGQALVASARTVEEPGRMVHSLHAYFLRPGDPKAPILYEVDRIRDGRSFSTRRVVALQHGRAIFNLQASFHDHEAVFDYQPQPREDVPEPESLPDFKTRMEPHRDRLGQWLDLPRPIDTRYVNGDPMSRSGQRSTSQLVWMRADGRLPDDPVLHACVVTYASDMTLLDTTLLPHGRSYFDGVQMASLDHAMWFHRPFRADEWMLYEQRAISSSSARGLAAGSIYTKDGELAVNVSQEGLIRPTS